MRIVNLIENTKGSRECLYEHGLSFYIETGDHKLLVDAGQTDAFLENAGKLQIDLSKIEHVILSHGHYDHAGGILGFTRVNETARIWMQRLALGAYYHKDNETEKYIGIDSRISELSQVNLLDGDYQIMEGICVFGGVTNRKWWPSGNLELKIMHGGQFAQDDFGHEQYLVIEEGDRKVLFSGCAHNGILNIIEKYMELYQEAPYAVFSGFHMRKKSGYTEEDYELIRQTARELSNFPTKFYTAHCTGEEPYALMKEIMGEQLAYIHSGDEVVI